MQQLDYTIITNLETKREYILRILHHAATKTNKKLPDIIKLFKTANKTTKIRLLKKYYIPRLQSHKDLNYLRYKLENPIKFQVNQQRKYKLKHQDIRLTQQQVYQHIGAAYEEYLNYIEEQKLQREAEQRQQRKKGIIITAFQDPTEEQLAAMARQLRQLQKEYYLDLDINFDDNLSITENYQQVLAYKRRGIELQPRQEITLIGNQTLLEDLANQN